MFGIGNGNKNEPVPKGVQLTGGGQESQEIKLSKLTEEILKEDIGFIRKFNQRLTEILNEKLSLLDGIGKSQQHIDAVLNKFGLSQDQLIEANVNVLTELKKFVADQGSANSQVINSLVNVIESLNQVVESQKQIIAAIGNPSVELKEIKIQTAVLAQPSQTIEAARTDSDTDAASDESLSDEPNEDFLSAERDDKNESDAGDSQTEQQTDPVQFAAQLLEDVRDDIFSIFGNETEIQTRPADDIPGIQFNEFWILALPPKTDGKYDSSVMQDTAFKKIKTLLPKNQKETVIAVYKGEISEKKLIGAKRVANDFKIVLTNFSDISRELARSAKTEPQTT